MTAHDFRRIALSMPEALEGSHMGHADFRVAKKIFATMGWPDAAWAMVKLTPEQQRTFILDHPAMFVPVKGGWGRRGSTNVRLDTADEATLRRAILTAWRNTAPKGLVKRSKAGDL